MSSLIDEYAYLIHLVKCAIHDRQPLEIPDLQWFQKVYHYGELHQIANIAFYSVRKLKRKPPQELYSQWELSYDMAFTRDINQSFARDEIVSEFQKASIRSLEVQGSALKKLYPQPEYRTMSDIDFIIDYENLPKAWAVLEQLGYDCKDAQGVEVDGYRAPNIYIEVHSQYFSKTSPYYSVMRPPFTSVEETGKYDINDLYCYNMLHIAKHYFGRGCGIRRVLDAYYLNLNYGEVIDKEYVQSVFKKAGMEEFVVQISDLANAWFSDEEDMPRNTKMESYIYNSGLHGTSYNHVTNKLKASRKEGVRFFRLKYILRRFIANPKNMYKNYPFLKRWKILYPFCWLHRGFKAVRNIRKNNLRTELRALKNGDWDD